MRVNWTYRTWAEALERRDPEAVSDALTWVVLRMEYAAETRSPRFTLNLGWTEDNHPGEHFLRLQRAVEAVAAEALRKASKLANPSSKRGRPEDPQRDRDIWRFVQMFMVSGLSKTAAWREVARRYCIGESAVRSSIARHEARERRAKKAEKAAKKSK
jgi:hypothetical protein